MNKKLNFLYILLCLVFVSSCIQEPTTSSFNDLNSSSDNTSENTSPETVGSVANYFQINTTTSFTTLSVDFDYNDSFLIRGDEIHQYIREQLLSDDISPTINRCLITRFQSSTSNKILAASLKVRSFYNPTVGIVEYYFQIEPNNEGTNTSDCSHLQVTNALTNLFPSESISYTIEDICPNCGGELLSDQIQLMLEDGSLITDIDTSNMRLNLEINSTNTTPITPNTTFSCSEDTVCTASDFDCCLEGQCVNHKAIKPGTDTNSSDYLSAILQISQNPGQITNYSNYFFICPSLTGTTNTDDTSSNPAEDLESELTLLKELHECLNPIDNEFSICTITQKNVSTLLEDTGEHTFNLPSSDITFHSLNPSLSENSIKEVTLSGVKIFEDRVKDIDPNLGELGTASDDLVNSQSFTLKSPLPRNNANDELKIRYRVDGTCKQLSTNLAQCTKTYVQGQVSSPASSDDHATSNLFKLPSYTDTNFNVIVRVGGSNISQSSSTWTLSGTNIIFNSSEYNVFPNQTVTATYFVTQNVSNLTLAQSQAQTRINEICACTGTVNCNLTPVYKDPNDTTSDITTYTCTTPNNNTSSSPLQETLFISSKSAAHKFYNSDGVYYRYEDLGTNKQECAVNSGDESNCTSFEYTNNNNLRPNNQDQYIGFNEIYGTISSNNRSAVSATEIDVQKGRTYDIFADEGVYSSCSSCGTDYYSVITSIFPSSFSSAGGGYVPNMVESRRIENSSRFNADDMKFARACFVPATMIPWTHVTNDDVTTQRRNRLKAQHFMFANGYNKDWYGFDYGSLIGSFDGVRWFSIGNQRNITAQTNKLYLAVNSYYSDQTSNNSFRVTISESVSVINSGSDVTSDIQSDGAQCQLAHICETDNDCLAQLGYDYSCENVGLMRTPWPRFDDDGNEVSGSNNLTIASLIGGVNGEPRRCVYRGRGSLCSQSASTITDNESYTQTASQALNTCSSNSFCSTLNSANFNNRISRYAAPPALQNQQDFIPTLSDIFGMDARILGRPLSYFGSELPFDGVKSQLETNNVSGMCVPGKNITFAITQDDLNNLDPFINKADENFEIGQTLSTISPSENYLAACPAVDSSGFFTFKSTPANEILNSGSHNYFAISQNMSTNLYQLDALNNSELFNDESDIKTQAGYNKNSCIRAPGASCFTDLDCSVNSWVATKFNAATNLEQELNEAERAFWTEPLVCSTSERRYPIGSIFPNIDYNAADKKCCMESNNIFTFYTQKFSGSSFNSVLDTEADELEPAIAGVNQDLDDPARYSRIHTIYDLLKSDQTNYPSLVTPNDNSSSTYYLGGEDTNNDSIIDTATIDANDSRFINQYKTLHAHNTRMCCSNSWVREFNSGGHQFTGERGQEYASSMVETFRALSWLPKENSSDINFFCTVDNADGPGCTMRHIVEGSDYENKWLEYFGKLELTGIPQIFIPSHESDYYTPVDAEQNDGRLQRLPVGNTLFNTNGILVNKDQDSDFIDANGTQYFSASSFGPNNPKFNSSNRIEVFSENKFACCLPTGQTVDSDVTNSQCCTGQVTGSGQTRRCCLNDYTDLSVYTNRYVSSEGAVFSGVEITDVDADGYLPRETVLQMGESMCCSGEAAYGVAISDLLVPVIGSNSAETRRRFIYDENLDDQNGALSRFTNGQKWNNHVYCVPSSNNRN